MSELIIGVDAGGSKTVVMVSRDGVEAGRATGSGAKMRSGKGIGCATTIAEVARRALAAAGALRANVLVAGVAGAGRELERDE
ncbi:MAG: hypothetical protein SGJ01_18040, partial [Gemmatimonadota bacterium]|nr:hypothetical protein [Gemmatimonadota bacterium]